MKVPERGDLVFINFNPQSGHEQAGHRPAIILSPKLFNNGKFAMMCPITRQVKGYPFEVIIPDDLKIAGAILTDQLRSLDWRSRNLKIVDRVPDIVVAECLEKIDTVLRMN